MAGRILIYTLLAVFAGIVLVPFVIGLVRGPEPDRAQPHPDGDASMRPLGRVAGIYLRFLGLYAFAAVVSFASGQRGAVCGATSIRTLSAGSAYTAPRSGAVVQAAGTVQACAPHPSAAQWVLELLIRLPGPVLLATILLVIWQLVREASRNGPFTGRTAEIMWRLGLVVLIGTAAAGALSRLGNDLLLRMLLADPPYIGLGVPNDVLFSGALRALLPVPLLAGVGLLTFARITRAGVVLDEEVRATV